jgi:hypothetical protein
MYYEGKALYCWLPRRLNWNFISIAADNNGSRIRSGYHNAALLLPLLDSFRLPTGQ